MHTHIVSQNVTGQSMHRGRSPVRGLRAAFHGRWFSLAVMAAFLVWGGHAAAGDHISLSDSVPRAAFTAEIEDREPVDDLKRLSTESDRVRFFTEIRDMQGSTVTHIWEYQGETQARVDFNVGGPRWRVWSSKTLLPAWTGEWQVYVVDEEGEILASGSLDYYDEDDDSPGDDEADRDADDGDDY